MMINRKIQNKTRIWGEGHCYSAVKLSHAERKHKWNIKYEVKDRGKQRAKEVRRLEQRTNK
jgi:hypothetical protein